MNTVNCICEAACKSPPNVTLAQDNKSFLAKLIFIWPDIMLGKKPVALITKTDLNAASLISDV